jgi:hypothetical protein
MFCFNLKVFNRGGTMIGNSVHSMEFIGGLSRGTFGVVAGSLPCYAKVSQTIRSMRLQISRLTSIAVRSAPLPARIPCQGAGAEAAIGETGGSADAIANCLRGLQGHALARGMGWRRCGFSIGRSRF